MRYRNGLLIGLLFLCCLLAGCSRTAPAPVLPPPPIFPPQKVMETGRYDEFLKDNESAVQRCGEDRSGCAVALFNLGFVYAYAGSPYRDLSKALPYFDELLKTSPQSPWAFQGQAWRVFLLESLAADESKRQLQADLKAREETIRTLRARLTRSRDLDIEMEKKQRELLR